MADVGLIGIKMHEDVRSECTAELKDGRAVFRIGDPPQQASLEMCKILAYSAPLVCDEFLVDPDESLNVLPGCAPADEALVTCHRASFLSDVAHCHSLRWRSSRSLRYVRAVALAALGSRGENH